MDGSTIPQKRKKEENDENNIIKDGTLTSAAENFFEALSMYKYKGEFCARDPPQLTIYVAEAGVSHCFVNL